MIVEIKSTATHAFKTLVNNKFDRGIDVDAKRIFLIKVVIGILYVTDIFLRILFNEIQIKYKLLCEPVIIVYELCLNQALMECIIRTLIIFGIQNLVNNKNMR